MNKTTKVLQNFECFAVNSIRFVIALLFAGATVSAQAPAQPGADPARYAVTYIEVTPSGVTQATAARKRYRGAIGRESGFASVDVFEQLGRPAHLVLVETWRDQAGFDAHQTATSLTTLKDALQPIRVSGYDLRPYRTLTVAPARAASGRNAHEERRLVGPSSLRVLRALRGYF